MKNTFKTKVAAIILATTILSSNYTNAWTLDDLKSYASNSYSSAMEYGKTVGHLALEFGKTNLETGINYSASKWNDGLSFIGSHLRQAYTIPVKLLKPSIGIISSSKDKMTQLLKIAKDSNPGVINIREEAKCLKTFSNSISDIANSLEPEKRFLSFFKSDPNRISNIVDKVAKNGITNSIEANTINKVSTLEVKAYDAFTQCVKNIPTEKLSILSKTIKNMRFEAYSDLIKIKFETIKYLFQGFLDTVAPENDMMQSTITWMIVLVGVPATTYGIYKLVKMIIKTMPTISKVSLLLAKKTAQKGLQFGKYASNKSFELSKYIAIKILSLLKVTSKTFIIDIPKKIVDGVIGFLQKNPLFTSAMLNGALVYYIVDNYMN